MSDQWFDLIVAEERERPQRGRQIRAHVAWISLASVALILAVLYAPLLQQEWPVAASPAQVETAAPAAQISGILFESQESLANLYEQIVPSVVFVQVTLDESSFSIPGFELPEGTLPQQSQGSGFIFDSEGHIVTNNHVVEGAESVRVVFHSGFWADAEVVAADPQADLAVLKVTPPEGMEWRPLPLEEADTLRVGHTVIAIGNPFGMEGTMTTGVVSALGRGVPVGDADVSRYTLPDVIQTDAAINPGNSGGPLVDLNGRVVGINFAIRSQIRANSGVGFAIPVSIVHRVVPALIENGKYSYAYLGVSGSSIGPELAERLEMPANELGVYVAEVIPGGPGDEAGLLGGDEVVTDDAGLEFRRGGDIIIAINGQEVRRFEDLVSYLVTKAAPGETVTLTIIRDGEQMQVEVTLGERPSGTGLATEEEPEEVTARVAIAIATRHVTEEQLLDGPVSEKVATPDEVDGVAVWVVELSTEGGQTATVTIDAATGEVLDTQVR
jgi:2-alkenal reductase